MDGRLEIDQHTVKLLIGERLISETTLKHIDKLVVVLHGNAVFHGEEPFYLIQTSDRVWVVPFLTEGFSDFLKAFRSYYGSTMLIYRAECERMPFTWRRRFLNTLPLFPIPRADCHSTSSIPAWKEDGPFAFADVPELRLEIVDDGL